MNLAHRLPASSLIVSVVTARWDAEPHALKHRQLGGALLPGGREDVVYGDIRWRIDRIRNVPSSVRMRRTLSTPATCSLARLAGAAMLRHDSLPAALAPLHWIILCSLINLIKTQVFFLDSNKCLPQRRRVQSIRYEPITPTMKHPHRDGPVLAAKFVIQSAIARHIAQLEDD